MNKTIVKDEILQEAVNEVALTLGEDLQTITIERAVVGVFFIGVKLSNGYGGVSYTPIKEIPEAVCCPSTAFAMPTPGKISGRPAVQFLKDIHSTVPMKKSFAIAVLNALSTTCWHVGPPEKYEVEVGVDPINVLNIKEDDNIAVIGALTPYLKRFKRSGQPFTVLELDPRTLKENELPFYKHADFAPEVLPEADVVIMTGTTLINNTVHELIDYCKEDAKVVIVGPTSSMLPGPFFKRGVTILGGIMVTDADSLLDMLSEGGSGYHFFGKSAEKIVIQ